MSKSCANCNAEIPEGASICDNCGMPVSKAGPPQQAPPQEAPAQPPPTPPLVVGSALDSRPHLEHTQSFSGSQVQGKHSPASQNIADRRAPSPQATRPASPPIHDRG